MVDLMTYPKRTRRLTTIVLLTMAMAVAGCANKSERVLFDGNYYPTKARAADKSDRQNFNVSVRRAAEGLRGARAAALHAGQQYCLKNYGTSEIAWTVAPDAPQATNLGSSGNLVASGRCLLW